MNERIRNAVFLVGLCLAGWTLFFLFPASERQVFLWLEAQPLLIIGAAWTGLGALLVFAPDFSERLSRRAHGWFRYGGHYRAWWGHSLLVAGSLLLALGIAGNL
jgi:hypothetical protein